MNSTPHSSRTAFPYTLRTTTGALVLGLCATLLSPLAATAAPAPSPGDAAGAEWAESAYRGGVDVVEDPDEDQDVIDGRVFEDTDRDSAQDPGERG